MATDLNGKKILLVKSLKKLIDSLERLEETKSAVHPNNAFARRIFSEFFQCDFMKMVGKLKTNIQIIERESFKCVFVGKTSNGKSAVINALLGDEVLPSTQGSTTCCFISIKGCDDDPGYILADNKENELDYLKKADKTRVDTCKIDTKLEMFYPKSKCLFLAHDVELIDTPGLDELDENDKWIDEYCKDADLFVLVLKTTSGLSSSEQRFFAKVNEMVSRPNVVVLVNKWDEKIDVEKNQHQMDISNFLKRSTNSDSNSIFFVSGTCGQKRKDQGFDDFSQFLLDKVTENRFNMKVTCRAGTVSDLATFLIEIPSILSNDIPKDVTDSQVESIISGAFSRINSRIIEEGKKVVSDIKAAIKIAGYNYDKVNDSTKELIEKTLPGNVSSIFSREIDEIVKNGKDLYLKILDPLKSSDSDTISQDKEAQIYVRGEEYWRKVKEDFRSEIQQKCSNIKILMDSLTPESEFESYISWLTFHIRKPVHETEYEKSYRNLENVLNAIRDYGLSEKICKTREAVTDNMGESRNLFNLHLQDMRNIKSSLENERSGWDGIKKDVLSGFP